LKEPNLAAEAAQGLFGAVTSYARGDLGGVFTSVNTLFKSATTGRNATQRARATKTSPADCVRRFVSFYSRCSGDVQISWSGCKDSQTSADAVEAGAATGAMSYVGSSPVLPVVVLL
jgi:metacaspase-1